MCRVRYFLALPALAGALLIGPIAVAQAAPPVNDAFAGATSIPSVPFSTTEDTTQATIDATDQAVATACSTPSGFTFGNSVWFAYTPSTDQDLSLSTSGSTYTVALSVLTGTPAGFTAVSCTLDSTTFHASAGTTYYIDLLDFNSTTGGTLSLSLTQYVAPNPVLTVDASGTFNSRSGTATVTGTASCGAGGTAFVNGTLSQSVGRLFTISGFGSPTSPIICDGSPHPWSFVVTPSSGKFKGGPATASVNLFACTVSCASQQVTQTISLKG